MKLHLYAYSYSEISENNPFCNNRLVEKSVNGCFTFLNSIKHYFYKTLIVLVKVYDIIE